ncbi:MAG: TlpA family protein disulfide reductase [Rhodothermales bacterium]|nr:TlpA family protein disulfide reductase [Rhodothermales bacterium]
MGSTFIIGMGVVMILVGAGFLVMLSTGRDSSRPRDVMEWTGLILSGLLIVTAAGLIWMTLSAPDDQPVQQAVTAAQFEDISIETPAGNFAFTHLESGEILDLEEYRGDVVIVNFWATWCLPCLEEIPDLNRLQQTYADSGLVILSVSDEDHEILRSFEERMPLQTTSVTVEPGIELPVPFRGALAIRPATYIVDRDGIARRYLLGARSYSFFETAIRPYI